MKLVSSFGSTLLFHNQLPPLLSWMNITSNHHTQHPLIIIYSILSFYSRFYYYCLLIIIMDSNIYYIWSSMYISSFHKWTQKSLFYIFISIIPHIIDYCIHTHIYTTREEWQQYEHPISRSTQMKLRKKSQKNLDTIKYRSDKLIFYLSLLYVTILWRMGGDKAKGHISLSSAPPTLYQW